MRHFSFAPGEHYHCYNRGVDKRVVFQDSQDYEYFVKLLAVMNTDEVVGRARLLENKSPVNPPVTMLTYNLLPNHYHLVLRCNTDAGISKYLQRVAGGYTMYFNNKNNRTGSLFQSKFKAKHIVTQQDLSQVVAYVHQNHLVHDISDKKLYRSALNSNNDLVRGLASDTSEAYQREVVDIIKNLRDDYEMK